MTFILRSCLVVAVALCCCQTLSAQTARDWRNYVEPALARLLIRDTAGAITMYNTIVRASGDSADAYMYRALLFANLKQIQNALKDFETAIHKDSNNVRYYLARGTLYLDTKQYPLAVKDFTWCIVLNPDFAQGFYYRGLTAMRLGDYYSASLDFGDVQRLDSTNVDAMLQNAIANINLKQFNAAKRLLTTAITFDSTFAQAFMLRAGILIDEDNKQQACSDLSQAVALGFKPAMEMLQTQCGKQFSPKTLDSLRSFTMQEITVEAESNTFARAAQEMKMVAQKAQRASRLIMNRIPTVLTKQADINLTDHPAIVGNGALQFTTLQTIESRRSSATNLDDFIYLARERAFSSGDAKAIQLARQLLQRRSYLAGVLQSGNTAEARSTVREIVDLIQDISLILNPSIGKQ